MIDWIESATRKSLIFARLILLPIDALPQDDSLGSDVIPYVLPSAARHRMKVTQLRKLGRFVLQSKRSTFEMNLVERNAQLCSAST